MSVSGPCEICTTAPIEDACERCGKLVCERHYEEESGRCVKCEAEISGEHPRHIPEEGDLPDGVDTYRF